MQIFRFEQSETLWLYFSIILKIKTNVLKQQNQSQHKKSFNKQEKTVKLLQNKLMLRKSINCSPQLANQSTLSYSFMHNCSVQNQIINLPYIGKAKKYRLQGIISYGAFGKVYQVYDTKKDKILAVKIESRHVKISQLLHQCNIYRILRQKNTQLQFIPVPEIYYCATEDSYNLLVMEKMGASLNTLFKRNGNSFSLKTTLYFAEQMLSILQFIHRRNIVHRDIKPANFCMGLQENSMKVYLIDFGLSKKYIFHDQQHIQKKKVNSFVGNFLYASINSHQRWQQTRRDDLQSLGYMLIHFCRGELPWEDLGCQNDGWEQSMIIKEKKQDISLDELCFGLPEQFWVYMRTVRDLRFDESPNYEFLRNLFRLVFLKNGFSKNDFDLC